jgi:hypothetical protein
MFFVTIFTRSVSMMATTTARVVHPSPFRKMKEGQSVVLNPPPKMFHPCKANLGMMRGYHQRYLIIHSQELVVMKPNRDVDSSGGVACLFKTAYDLRGVRARVQRKAPTNVDVVDPNGKTTYSFETKTAAGKKC